MRYESLIISCLRILKYPQYSNNKPIPDLIFTFDDKRGLTETHLKSELDLYLHEMWIPDSYVKLPLINAYIFSISFMGIMKLLEFKGLANIELNTKHIIPEIGLENMEEDRIIKSIETFPIEGEIKRIFKKKRIHFSKNNPLYKSLKMELMKIFIYPLINNDKSVVKVLSTIKLEQVSANVIEDSYYHEWDLIEKILKNQR